MLDVMTANRDLGNCSWVQFPRIDDSNVPAPVPVKSNIGGKSRSSNKSKEGYRDYLSPQETLKKLRGF